MQQVPPDMLSMEVTTETNPDERNSQNEVDARSAEFSLSLSLLTCP